MAAKAAIPDLPARLIAASESLVLGNVLNRGAEFWRVVSPELDESHFSVERHTKLFRLIREVSESGQSPLLSACYGHLLETQAEKPDLLLSGIASDAFDIPDHETAVWVAKLKRKKVERRAWQLAERLRFGMEFGVEDTAAELSKYREELRSLEADLDTTATPSTLADAVAGIGVDNLLCAPQGLIGSPWPRLTERINDGMRPGELWIVAARPSVGKTTVALQWALEAAQAGKRVLFVSLEMPVADLVKRAISAKGGIHHGALMRGDLDETLRRRVAETLDRIGGYRIELTDKLRRLRAIVAHIAAARPAFDLVVVDYLGLIESDSRFENRTQEVSALSRQLKLAAMDYDVPILCAHQLNRANSTERRRPELSDLRDSGSIEQDADAVILLDDPAAREQARNPGSLDAILAKQRNGERGVVVSLRMEPHFCRIAETSVFGSEGAVAA